MIKSCKIDHNEEKDIMSNAFHDFRCILMEVEFLDIYAEELTEVHLQNGEKLKRRREDSYWLKARK